MYIKITSKDNSRIKAILGLYKSKQRNLNNLMIIEGIREIKRAINANWPIEEFYFSEEFLNNKILDIIKESNIPLIECTKDIFSKISYQNNPDGLLAISKIKKFGFNDIKINKKLLIIVAEGIEKPGNLGSILRTADGAGVNALIIVNNRTDITNPNIIRSSVGSIFNVPIIETNFLDLNEWLRDNKIKSVITSPKAKDIYSNYNFNGPTAIFVGSESKGLSNEIINSTKDKIFIPMHGINDSLNVSVSIGIIIYEALRQRRS